MGEIHHESHLVERTEVHLFIGNLNILVEMFQSVTHHSLQCPSMDSADNFHECTHEPLTHEQQASTKWLTPN